MCRACSLWHLILWLEFHSGNWSPDAIRFSYDSAVLKINQLGIQSLITFVVSINKETNSCGKNSFNSKQNEIVSRVSKMKLTCTKEIFSDALKFDRMWSVHAFQLKNEKKKHPCNQDVAFVKLQALIHTCRLNHIWPNPQIYCQKRTLLKYKLIL